MTKKELTFCKLLLALVLFLALLPSALCSEMERVDVAVTAYNVDRAVIKDTRKVELRKGENWVSFSDVAARIDPTSVHLTSPEILIKEQNFDYDLVSDAKLLNKYLGEYVAIADKEGNLFEGKLIVGSKAIIDHKGNITYSFENLVIEDKSGFLTILPKERVADVRFPLLPGGLITRPTLNWKILSHKKGGRPCEIAYMTGGMSWRADYDLVLSAGSVTRDQKQKVDLSGMVTLDNQTGATYKDAKLKLVAGEVHVVEDERFGFGMAKLAVVSGYRGGPEKAPQFKEKEFFEYHLYTLQRRATLKDNQTKQIDFVDARDITADRIYVYNGAIFTGYYGKDNPSYGTKCNKKVDVYLEFNNSEENNLGIPLPEGKMRIKEKDEEGKITYLGEDEIDHTPKDEKILLKVGSAFDLVGERKQVDFKRIDSHTVEEAFEISLRNHKKKDVKIRVVEHLYRWADWQITAKSAPFLKTDSKTIEFRIRVPAGGTKTVAYRVRYKH